MYEIPRYSMYGIMDFSTFLAWYIDKYLNINIKLKT